MEPAQSVHGITVMLDQETLRQNGHLTVEEFLNQQMDFQVWFNGQCVTAVFCREFPFGHSCMLAFLLGGTDQAPHGNPGGKA